MIGLSTYVGVADYSEDALSTTYHDNWPEAIQWAQDDVDRMAESNGDRRFWLDVSESDFDMVEYYVITTSPGGHEYVYATIVIS